VRLPAPIAPPTMLSVWFRPHFWARVAPSRSSRLQVHFDSRRSSASRGGDDRNHDRVSRARAPGDRLRTRQILRSVSPLKETKLGVGRFWVIDVEYLNQKGELVGKESYTGYGYRRAS